MDFLRRSWAEVDLDALAHNVQMLRQNMAPQCLFMGVVKADAYGHGEAGVVAELLRQGADWFGVATVEEAVSLRRLGVAKPILILGATPAEQAGVLAEHEITQTVFSSEYAQALHRQAEEQGVRLRIHIKVDTGMSRLGFGSGGRDTAVNQIQQACALERFDAEGIFTHFACADEQGEDSLSYTKEQYRYFLEIIARLEEHGRRFALRHCCNSAGTIRFPEMHLDMVRPGIAQYGLLPGDGCAGLIDLQPVMSLYSAVAQVKTVEQGTPVSYGRRFTAQAPTRVATVPLGYADGYPRQLGNKAQMLVRGQRVPVIGRVCMDQLMLDVTEVAEVLPGDLVTVAGSDGEEKLPFDEMASLCGTIHYERVCAVGKRLPRVYLRAGEIVAVSSYLQRG